MPDNSRRVVRGILSGPLDEHRSRAPRQVEASPGLAVTHRDTGFRGQVVRLTPAGVVIRAPGTGIERQFPLIAGSFLIGGAPATLTRPAGAAPAPTPASAGSPTRRTASGSIDVGPTRARTARASRILVEGVHDAELVEKVWGDDLRVDGIVVEMLDGVDHLVRTIDDFGPGPDARLGVLVDHLVPGSKEQRIVSGITNPHVLVRGTPFVDVWQAIRPGVVGLERWPEIPLGTPWKQGICSHFGEPSAGRLWKRLLGQVRTYADLEADLVGSVEELIDFVTDPES